MWEKPEPSASEMLERFTNTTISNGGTYSEIPSYCAFSKENSTTCSQLEVGSYDANGIIYERDQYWNKSATIPSQASVLLMSSKLDPQTPHKYAGYLLEALDGGKKELITFNYATHGTLWTTPMNAGDDSSETCGMKLLMSYVTNDGDLSGLDKSCVDEMPVFNVTVPRGYLHYFLSMEDAYDGQLDIKWKLKYKAVFIVFLVLFVVALVVAGFFMYRWYELKQQKSSSRATDDEHIEISTPVAVGVSSPEVTSFTTQQIK